MDTVNHLDITNEPVIQESDIDEPILKPKRPRTEAQIAAFEKAREKGHQTLASNRAAKAAEFADIKMARLVIRQEKADALAAKRSADIAKAAEIIASKKTKVESAPNKPAPKPVPDKPVTKVDTPILKPAPVQRNLQYIPPPAPKKPSVTYIFG